MAEKDGYLGLGDVIEAAARRVGIKTCAGCQKRKRALNRALPRVWKAGSSERPAWMDTQATQEPSDEQS